MAEVRSRSCRYCFQDINTHATVCHHCSREQYWLSNWVKLADVISTCLLLVAIFQLYEAFQATQKAEQALTRAAAANSKADDALNKASETRKQVLEARSDVLEVAQAVTEIAAILPRTGRFGGGLSDTDTAVLKKQLDLLENKIRKLRTQ